MLKIESRCLDCTSLGLPCIGISCPNRSVEVHYCNKCGDQLGKNFYKDGDIELCADCEEDMFRKER